MSDVFTCPYCHLRFSTRTEFTHHLDDEHQDRRPPAEDPAPA